jgi:hypothetical protein
VAKFAHPSLYSITTSEHLLLPSNPSTPGPAGLANLSLRLAWLRLSEVFGLKWLNFMVVEPADGPEEYLPVGCGAVSLRLSPETKSSRTKRVNACVAHKTLSGFHIGKWLHHVWVASGVSPD